MTEKEIRILMIQKDIRAIDISRKEKVHKSMITNILKRRTKSKRIETAIAKELEVPVDELFPPKEAA